jgi:hypothetical protein
MVICAVIWIIYFISVKTFVRYKLRGNSRIQKPEPEPEPELVRKECTSMYNAENVTNVAG